MSLSFPATRWSLIGRLGETPEATSILLELCFDSIARYVRFRFPEEAKTGELDDVVQEVAVHVMERPDLLASARPGLGSRFRYLLMTVAFIAAPSQGLRGVGASQHPAMRANQRWSVWGAETAAAAVYLLP